MRWLWSNDPQLADAGPLYGSVVAAARRPQWYREGGVPDTIDGRFAVLATLLALTDLRLGAGGETARALAPRMTETFVADMDAQLREAGIGDPGLGKQVRAMVGALAGRIERWRATGDGGDEGAAICDSLYRGADPGASAVAAAAGLIREWRERLAAASDEALAGGAVQ